MNVGDVASARHGTTRPLTLQSMVVRRRASASSPETTVLTGGLGRAWLGARSVRPRIRPCNVAAETGIESDMGLPRPRPLVELARLLFWDLCRFDCSFPSGPFRI